MTACVQQSRVDRHFGSGLPKGDEHALRAHLPSCAACRDRYERHLVLEKLEPGGAPGSRGERIARGLGLDLQPKARRPWYAPAPILAAAAIAATVALAVNLMVMTRGDGPNGGFSARGGATEAPSRVLVYRAVSGEKAVRAGDSIGAHDGLAFAYENGAAKKHLVIFGIDEHRHVYWYHPAWTNPTEDPVSLTIERTGQAHYLPESIAHDLDGEELVIHAVFTDAPLSVKTVERMIAAKEPFRADAIESTIRFAVKR